MMQTNMLQQLNPSISICRRSVFLVQEVGSPTHTFKKKQCHVVLCSPDQVRLHIKLLWLGGNIASGHCRDTLVCSQSLSNGARSIIYFTCTQTSEFHSFNFPTHHNLKKKKYVCLSKIGQAAGVVWQIFRDWQLPGLSTAELQQGQCWGFN